MYLSEKDLNQLMSTHRRDCNAYGERMKPKCRQQNGYWPSEKEDGRKRGSYKRASKVINYNINDLSPRERIQLGL